MSFYENNIGAPKGWTGTARQTSWEQQPRSAQNPTSTTSPSNETQAAATGSRTNPSSSLPSPDPNAFASQFEEIERATDNLVKSGRWFPGAGVTGPPLARRDSAPQNGRGYDYGADHRGPNGARHHSISSEFDASRPGSAGLQGFYAGQRFPSGRQSEAEQVLQAKRRMAAQRERELRNYHQEQQYNRTSSISNAKPERAMSPNTAMSEEERRDLIASQHRALYGNGSSLYNTDAVRAQDGRGNNANRGQSPLAFDPYGAQPSTANDTAVQMPTRDRAETTTSPIANQSQAQFGHLNETATNGRTSASSPTSSPPLVGGSKGIIGGVAPIGTRPVQGPNSAGPMSSKRSTTPLTPSSLSYGFANSAEGGSKYGKDDRTSASVPSSAITDKGTSGMSNWGSSNGVWGSSKTALTVQPSVWG